MNKTASRIRQRWLANGHRLVRRGRNTIMSGSDNADLSEGIVTYPTSAVTNLTSDFLGDWRATDMYQRFDMLRVRNRSRQLERGNPFCIAFKRNMLNNVIGYKGFYDHPAVVDADGNPDEKANAIIAAVRKDFGRPENFTTRKRLSRVEADRLWLSRLIFDGEVILRKVRGFEGNSYGFAWQFINSDYLDHNLNRTLENGNVIKMGVELDGTYKFPVNYWFLRIRPNDYIYSPADYGGDIYYKVPAEEIFHTYLITEDDEQTRGWPWVFAAATVLFRLGKYQEAALINAAIGASRGVYFEKKYPEGFTGSPEELNDDAEIVVDLPQGSGLELPYGVEAKTIDMKYPDHEFADFCSAMMLTAGMVFGTSYMTTTGDLSKANFVSSRIGQTEERETFKAIQEFMINRWKIPGSEEELHRFMLARKVPLPFAKFDQFKAIEFAGRRWPFVQPVDDMKAAEMKMDNLICAPSDIVAETTQEDFEDVLKRCQKDKKLMEKYGLTRVSSGNSMSVSSGQSVAESSN